MGKQAVVCPHRGRQKECGPRHARHGCVSHELCERKRPDSKSTCYISIYGELMECELTRPLELGKGGPGRGGMGEGAAGTKGASGGDRCVRPRGRRTQRAVCLGRVRSVPCGLCLAREVAKALHSQ